MTPSGGVAYTELSDKPGFGRSLVLRGLMPMMCAVASNPFWAGLHKNHRAHPSFVQISDFRDKVYFDSVGNYTPLVAFLQQ